jgi:tetratricopeptide (TPR) repeat protein
MPTDRIKQLEQFYEEDPSDPFNSYALALEYMKTEPEQARRLFEILLASHASYLPVYYQAARFYLAYGDKEKAIAIYENGIALARKLNDTKAQRELQSAYDEMMFE